MAGLRNYFSNNALVVLFYSVASYPLIYWNTISRLGNTVSSLEPDTHLCKCTAWKSGTYFVVTTSIVLSYCDYHTLAANVS